MQRELTGGSYGREILIRHAGNQQKSRMPTWKKAPVGRDKVRAERALASGEEKILWDVSEPWNQEGCHKRTLLAGKLDERGGRKAKRQAVVKHKRR